MPLVGKSFTTLGKDAFSPMTVGKRDLLLNALLAFRETGWRKASELPFHSLELIWAAERGLIIIRAESQWWPPGENPPCVKAVFEASGTFLYRRCITALLQHPSTPLSWQTTPGRSDWTTPVVLQFKLNGKSDGLQAALSKQPDRLAALKTWLKQLEKRFDYNGRGGVFDGRSTKQSQEDALRLADSEFRAVKLIRLNRDGVLKWEDVSEAARVVVWCSQAGGVSNVRDVVVTARRLATWADVNERYIREILGEAGHTRQPETGVTGHPAAYLYLPILKALRQSFGVVWPESGQLVVDNPKPDKEPPPKNRIRKKNKR